MPIPEAEPSTVPGEPPPMTRILLVDDSDSIRLTLTVVLENSGFEVVAARNVHEALRYIATQSFDVLLSDLHMPQPGDGLTVVSAMRHSHPKAVTLIFSAYPEMKHAAAAILLQADDILVKPLAVDLLIQTIRERLAEGAKPEPSAVEDVASILEHETQSTIDEWLQGIEKDAKIVVIKMNSKRRSAHLPQLFRDLVSRLRNPLPLGTRALVSPSAAEHGFRRREQGYTATMMVEESRMLQVSIFQTLQNNLHKIDFSMLLVGVMAIADEVDSQLAQQMACYVAEARTDGQPILA